MGWYHALNILPIVALWACLLYPWFALGACGKAALFSLLPPMACSFVFVVVTQVSHIQPETQQSEHADETDFQKRQVSCSCAEGPAARALQTAHAACVACPCLPPCRVLCLVSCWLVAVLHRY